MKIEIGESLIRSWLRHVNSCQIVEQNWKSSGSWDSFIEDKEIEKILKELKKHFKSLDVNFISKKQKSTQMIKQGEIDCLGFSFDIDSETKICIKNIYAVDIAFHEAGLNYGNINDSCSRITKKYIRTALTLYQYFGIKTAEIVFATPKTTNENHANKLKETAINVSKIFNDLGFNFDFKMYTNQDFQEFIHQPLINKINEISDTSELFIRSIKLLNLLQRKGDSVVKTFIRKENSDFNNSLFEAVKPKIAIYAQSIFDRLSKQNLLNLEDLDMLCDINYSKDNFKISMNLPILKRYPNDNNDIAFIDGRRRYYAQCYEFQGNKYLLCNHWIDNQFDSLEKWSEKFLLLP